MLVKLLKYDFKDILKKLLPFYIILIILALLTRLSFDIMDSVKILKVTIGILIALLIIMIISCPIASFIYIIKNYFNNLVKKEGYLIHTLPVTKNSIILSKLITAVSVTLISVIFSLLAVYLGFILGRANVINEIVSIVSEININYEFLILIIISMFSTLILQYLIIFLAIGVGQLHNKNKGIMSIIYSVIFNYINQIICSIIIVIPMLFNTKIKKLILDNQNPDIYLINEIIYISLFISFVFIFIYFIVTSRIMAKKLNLE